MSELAWPLLDELCAAWVDAAESGRPEDLDRALDVKARVDRAGLGDAAAECIRQLLAIGALGALPERPT
jgi:hypothetical protein